MSGATPRSRPRLRIACVVVLTLAWHAAVCAVPEYEVKAALIYKIGKFVRWPDRAFAAGGTLKVCIIGKDDFGATIDTLTGRRLQGQVIAVERVAGGEAAALECHIAFVGRSEAANLAAHLAVLSRAPVLTISDIEGFAAQGGMVGFATADSKISFQINPAASKRAGIEIGAQLLQFATLVAETPGGTHP